MQGQRVVITGGTGFIGSHLAERLVELGNRVVIFDNCAEHDLYEETRELLEKRKDYVTYVQGDVRNKGAVDAAIKGADVVYHLAALLGTSARFGQEVLTVEVNVIGTINVLQAALDAGVKYFIHPPRPALTQWLTPYIISKTAQTLFTDMYHRVYGLPTVGLNIQNCYGPRERSVLRADTRRPGEGRKLVATCIVAALKNEPLPIFGDGTQSSDFVYVDDVVDALVKAPTEAAVGHVMDIGTGISTPVKRVAELIIELTGSKSKIEYLPMRTGEVKLHTKADLSAAKQLIGWEPTTSLEEGLRKTIPYYARLLGVPSPI
ncbi:MAG: SDR family NAD(P)-dependent oxidoreductase [Bacillota bacterium]